MGEKTWIHIRLLNSEFFLPNASIGPKTHSSWVRGPLMFPMHLSRKFISIIPVCFTWPFLDLKGSLWLFVDSCAYLVLLSLDFTIFAAFWRDGMEGKNGIKKDVTEASWKSTLWGLTMTGDNNNCFNFVQVFAYCLFSSFCSWLGTHQRYIWTML